MGSLLGCALLSTRAAQHPRHAESCMFLLCPSPDEQIAACMACEPGVEGQTCLLAVFGFVSKQSKALPEPLCGPRDL